MTEWESNGTPSSPFGPDGFAWESPEQLMAAMAASLERQGTEIDHAIILGEDPDLVFGWVRITTPDEDATVAGDLRLRIERIEGSWAATLAEIRRHCRFEPEGSVCPERGGPAPVETAPPEESVSPSAAASDFGGA